MRIDDETAGLILRRLDEDPATPSTVDVARAVTDGRRRRRVRRAGGSAAAGGAVALLLVGVAVAAGAGRTTVPPPGSGKVTPAATATAPTACTLALLPIPDGRTMALVTGGDPSGRFLLGRTYPANPAAGGGMGLHVVVWDRLAPRIVQMPGDDQSLHDINRNGVAVGTSWGGSGETAYAYRDGRVTKLPGGDGAEVRAINDAGAAVGSRADRPVLWRSVDRPPVALALPAGAVTGAAYDIDEDGTVIGVVGNGKTMQRPYVWAPDGAGHDLALPTGVPAPTGKPGKSGAARGVPTATVFHIREGWVSGRVYDDAARWNLRTGEIRTFPDVESRMDGINRYGWQIGIDRQGHAQFVADAAPVVLPDLAQHEPGGLHNIPSSLSDDGKVIGGQSDDRAGVIRAVVWTCA